MRSSFFWDVSKADNVNVIDLKGEEYHQLIVEVENPAAAIDLLNNV